jgi:hypothetical protein
VALRDRVAAEMGQDATLRRLLQCADVALYGSAPPAPGYRRDLHPTDDLIRNILNRIGGGQVNQELLLSQGIGANAPNPSMITTHEKRGTTSFLVELDAPFLVAYAVPDKDKDKSDEAFDEYLSVFTNYNYPEYRFRSLWILLGGVLQHPDVTWVQKTVQKIFISALGGGSVEFEEALPTTVLALQASIGDSAVLDYLNQRASQLIDEASRIKIGRGGDSWSYLKRHMLALAQAFARLHVAEAHVSVLLDRTAEIEASGFAGYQAAANLVCAETAYIVHAPVKPYQVEQALGFAQTAAHQIQDPTFCARITARVNAIRRHWWGNFDVEAMAQGLRETPQAPEFAALYDIGHEFTGRDPQSLELPDWMTAANTLTGLARVFNRPVEALLSLNRDQGWSADEGLGKGAEVRIPDPGFAPHLAARLAAEALANINMAPDVRIEIIRSLVPTALPSPTALDAVLARLALAWGMGHPEAITPPLVAALRQEAPLTDVRHPVPPIGELIG